MPLSSSSTGFPSHTFWVFVFITGLALYGIWALSSILFPFIAAFAIAYLLTPAVNALSRLSRGLINRQRGSLLILALFFITVIIFAGLTLPFLIREMLLLASNLPDSIDTLWINILETLTKYGIHMDTLNSDGGITELLKSTLTPGLRTSAEMLSNILSGGQAAIGGLITLFLIPLLAYFMMAEWPKMIDALDGLIPRPMLDTIRTMAQKIDYRLSGFIRGQVIVCFILTIYYIIGLWVIGMPYAVLLGLLSGIMIIIPFFGVTLSVTIALIIAAFQVSETGYGILGAVLVLYVIGQLVEGNIITPKIIGNRVGLHPIAIIFALMVGGYMLGIFGMMIAIPVAAIAAVLIEYGLARYQSSRLYHGT